MKAPDGQRWVCAACGKHAKDRKRIGDESCYLHAVLVHESTMKFRDNGLCFHAAAVEQ